MVVWNDQHRLKALLKHLRPYFSTLAVVVQESPDNTKAVANLYADIVLTDAHRGFGDASFGPILLPAVSSPWTFKVDADEWPSDDLLQTLGDAVAEAEAAQLDGMWVTFHSAVDDIEYEEQHGHLRLFRTKLGWPATLHSRPMTDNTGHWQTGFVRHDRTMDELVQDYLRYLEIGRGNAGWTDHNMLMIRAACSGTAQKKGWSYVRSYSWWPEVVTKAYGGVEPPDDSFPIWKEN